jgi:DNA-binding NarL/FixJ family response regulator
MIQAKTLAKETDLRRARVLLADDHRAVRENVVALLEEEFDVVGAVADGKEMLTEVRRLDPDVVVLDISMPLLDGIEAAIQLSASDSKAKIVFLTVQDDLLFVRRGLAAGALGYVVKSHVDKDLTTAIHEVLAGNQFISPSLQYAKKQAGKEHQQ